MSSFHFSTLRSAHKIGKWHWCYFVSLSLFGCAGIDNVTQGYENDKCTQDWKMAPVFFGKLSVIDILGSEFHVEEPITAVSTDLVPTLER